MILGDLTPDDVFALVDLRTQRTFAALCVLSVLVGFQILLKMFETYRILTAVRKMDATGTRVSRHLEMAAEHGRITDDKKVQIEQVVNSASARAGVAALKADAASTKVEAAVARLSEAQERMDRDLHALARQVEMLVAKMCPEINAGA